MIKNKPKNYFCSGFILVPDPYRLFFLKKDKEHHGPSGDCRRFG